MRPESEAVATGTINDDDPEPTLSVLNSITDEGEPLNFTAYLDAPSGRTVSATYTTTNDTDGAYPATPEDDYITSSGLLSFSPGETTKTIAVTTLFDAATEAPETLQLALSNPRYTTLINPATATGTIRNQEPPAITINDSSALEGDPMVFTLNLDRPSDTEVTVTYADIPARAIPQIDYTLNASTQVTIPIGQTQADLTVFTVADRLSEPNEAFLIELTGVTGNARILDGVAIGTILESAVAPSLTVNDVQTPEGHRGHLHCDLDSQCPHHRHTSQCRLQNQRPHRQRRHRLQRPNRTPAVPGKHHNPTTHRDRPDNRR